MIKEFFVIDFSYENDPSPKAYMWTISKEGKRSLLIKDDFYPYFYVLPRSDSNLKEKILELSSKNYEIKDVSNEKKIYLGKELDVLKVTCSLPTSIRYFRDVISKMGDVKGIFEADIRFSMRFSIDSRVPPFTWIEADVERIPNDGFIVDEAYRVKSLRSIDKEEVPSLRLLSFDINVNNKYGSINPRRDPLLSICIISNDSYKVLESDGIDDSKIIKDFVSVVREEDPDIIGTLGSYQWNYIIQRASFRNIKLDVSRKEGADISTGTYGHYSSPGRLNVNIGKFVRNILGIDYEQHSDKIDIYPYFDVKRNQSAECPLQWNLLNKIMELGILMSRKFGMPMDQLFSASMYSALEWILVRKSVERNILVPNKKDAYVRIDPKANLTDPIIGLHDDVLGLFFNSLPPSILESYNISPETIDGSFDGKGFLPSVVPSIYSEVERELKERFGDRISKDLTAILANTITGYFSWSGSRWLCPQCGKNLDKLIMYTMKNYIEDLKRKGASVLFARGNTILVKGIDEFPYAINVKYNRVVIGDDFFIGIDKHGVADPISLAFPYGDWSEAAKRIYVRVTGKLLRESVDSALKDVRQEVMRIRRGDFDIKEMIIWRELDKEFSMYKQPYPLFVVAAMKAYKQGFVVNKGDKVGYVICEGGVRLSDKVEPFFSIKDKKRIDKEFYVDKQIIPIVMHVLKPLGIKEKDLKEGGFDISNYFRR
ncbi:DNA polymerase domain-containing protein [Sulfuracidifex metallicus]|uniref:DNA polymerase domain-containing protein n=1 Tax=Sulfuracidifex metallicus TaxID=47303 RepID=UPI0022732E7B|nr:3'-5' exonuclease [Sulfuracidifex metallicus]MCY0850864.1 hypothetical protein [Sulfuracidifex metallicus]